MTTKVTVDVVCVTDEEIAEHKQHMRGASRHDPKLAKKHKASNVNKYDVFVPHDTNLSQSAYNALCKFGRDQRRYDEGRGKWK